MACYKCFIHVYYHHYYYSLSLQLATINPPLTDAHAELNYILFTEIYRPCHKETPVPSQPSATVLSSCHQQPRSPLLTSLLHQGQVPMGLQVIPPLEISLHEGITICLLSSGRSGEWVERSSTCLQAHTPCPRQGSVPRTPHPKDKRAIETERQKTCGENTRLEEQYSALALSLH